MFLHARCLLRLLIGLSLLAGFAGLCVAQTAPLPKSPVKALVLVGWTMKIDPTLQTQLAAEDIQFVTRKLSDPLNMTMLRQFHLVVIADWEGTRVGNFMKNYVSDYITTVQNVELLQRYLQDGGGLFFTPAVGGAIGSEALTKFMQPYGARVEALQIRDDAHAFVTKYEGRMDDEYAWTTAITPHPATAGVTRLFYPTTELRWDDMYSTPVVDYTDPAWTVIVRGMPSSVGAKGIDYVKWIPQSKTPAIAAVRQYGKGRIAVLAPHPYFTLWEPYADPARGWIGESHTGKITGTVLEKGDGTLASDGKRLLIGLFRWVAQASGAQGMGGYTEQSFAAIQQPMKAEAPGWLYSWHQNSGNKWFKVLVGARSAYSDGTGTIAEYAAAAKAAGVDMLVMTETFEKFDAKNWEQFREDCRKASDDQIIVVSGLDIPDTYGARFLLTGTPVYPPSFSLTPDGKAMAKTHYLCLTFPKGTTIAHRVTSSPIEQELVKHFQGITIYTYKNGVLEDNSLPAYQWELFRFSNPIPYVVHETYTPGDIAKEAATGHQMYVAADTLANMGWYTGEHGTTHFWDSPVHVQVSNGPRITAYGGAPFLSVESDEPITEVRLYENYNLYRRWTPNTKTFSVDRVKLPDSHVTWSYLVATDAKGRTAISPGIISGKQAAHTWRCGDRQNWWSFPNIYTGTDVSQFAISVPTFGTDEAGRGIFYPQRNGVQRGDNIAPILDFPYASPAVYIQDVFIDQRYYRALFSDVAYDAKPANATARSRVYASTVRYLRFYPKKTKNDKTDFLPEVKEISISLRMPVEPTGTVFPQITTLDVKNAEARGDMSYAYIDPATRKAVTGKLTQGYLDLPKGGRIGGFIALSDGIRVAANGQVGFAPPAWSNGALPTGTTWTAKFVTVKPEEAEKWRALMGLTKAPFSVSLTQGQLTDLAYVADCRAQHFGIAGTVGATVTEEYGLPMQIAGINYNWTAGMWRPGSDPEEFGVFEGKGWTRLDVTKAGEFYAGNLVQAGDPNLRLAIIRWTATLIDIEVHNPTDRAITTDVWTAPAIRDHLQIRQTVTIPAGASTAITGKK